MTFTNPVHLIFIVAVALIFLGPKRLPEVARSLGAGMREFRQHLHGTPPPQAGAPTVPSAAVEEAAPPPPPPT